MRESENKNLGSPTYFVHALLLFVKAPFSEACIRFATNEKALSNTNFFQRFHPNVTEIQ